MVRESRDNFILRKMREERMENLHHHASKSAKLNMQLESAIQENKLLRKNIYDLQYEIRQAYIRIKELTGEKQLELPL